MSGLFAGSKWERPVTCEKCEKPLAECACPRDASGTVCLPKDQSARVSRERRGGGKVVTIISGLNPKASDLPAMLKSFKRDLGAGGTVVEDRIELQGDHRDKVMAALKVKGYPAKISGG